MAMAGHETQQPLKGAELRKAVTEWTAKGCAVKIGPDGTIDVRPPTMTSGADHVTDYDKADMKI